MPENMNKYKDAYISEARDHIKQMNKALLALEKNPRQLTYLREIFRHVHTLKSMAATMGYQQTMTLCHALEDMLDEVKQKKLNVKLCANLLFESFDMLERLVRCVKEDKPELDAVPLLSKLKQRLNNPTQEGDVPGREDFLCRISKFFNQLQNLVKLRCYTTITLIFVESHYTRASVAPNQLMEIKFITYQNKSHSHCHQSR